VTSLRAELEISQQALGAKSEQLAQIEGRSVGTETAAARLEREKRYLEETLSTLTAELSVARRERREALLQYEELVNGDLRSMQSENIALKSENGRMSEELGQLRSGQIQLDARVRRSEDEAASERAASKQLQKRCDELDAKYAFASSELNKLASANVQMQGMLRYLQEEEETLSSTVMSSYSMISSGDARVPAPEAVSPTRHADGSPPEGSPAVHIASSIRSKTAELASVRRQLQEVSSSKQRLQDAFERAKDEWTASQSQLAVATSRLHALEAEHSSAVRLLEDRDAQLSRATSSVSALQMEVTRLTNIISSRDAMCNALSLSEKERLEKIETLSVALDTLTSENRLLLKRLDDSSRSLAEQQRIAAEAGQTAAGAIARAAAAERAAEASASAQRDLAREHAGCEQMAFEMARRADEGNRALEKARAELRAVTADRDSLQQKVCIISLLLLS
jgi:chromosome segregation ATPase